MANIFKECDLIPDNERFDDGCQQNQSSNQANLCVV